MKAWRQIRSRDKLGVTGGPAEGWESDSGSSLLEFAAGLVTLMGLMFCFMEICLLFYSYCLISELAREGSRYAMVRGASCPTTASPTCEVTAAQVGTYVKGIALPNVGGGTISVNTTTATMYPDGNENVGSRVKVIVTYVFPIKMPFVPRNSVTMSSTSEMYIIQ
jgi:Flp pilus assembly protein TadG